MFVAQQIYHLRKWSAKFVGGAVAQKPLRRAIRPYTVGPAIPHPGLWF
jgi:hypothetical protein